MTEQVEKVARAICCHKNGVFSGCSAKFDNSPFTVCQAHTFMNDARAAISATPPDDSVARIVAWLRDTAAYTQDQGLNRAADMIEKADWK